MFPLCTCRVIPRAFKSDPSLQKMFTRAEGIYYYDADNRKVIDGVSGLWCCNAGHGQEKIHDAVKAQLDKMAYAPSFQTSHDLPFEFSEKLLNLFSPHRQFNQVFFTMCGSTAVDTAMKMALAYHKAKGDSSRIRFIGRERGYHGVGFGGISVGGISPNRKAFAGGLLPFVDHLPHTHSLQNMAFSRGLPTWGEHLADDLERLCVLHDPSTIAAVIMEPVPGSTGVLPPPVGYLQKIRKICEQHDILLIFDEVITGFGRTGPSFATELFDITPDIVTMAKGLTNAVIPCGAVVTSEKIYKVMVENARALNSPIELFHGFTYSGHPLAMAAGVATIDVFEEQNLFEKAIDNSPYFEDLVHSMKGLPHVVDTRNCGLMGAVETEPIPGELTKRSSDIFHRCFSKGLFVRATGQTIALSPPLTSSKSDLKKMIEILSESIVESSKHC